MKTSAALLLIVTFATLGLVVPVTEGRASEAKEKLESALIGQWKVPKNRYKETITFEFTTARKFECVHTVPKEEPVTWSGDWKVRTTHGGTVKAYLLGRSQADPEKYLRAFVTSGTALESFIILINFDFKSTDKENWKSKLIRASAADEDDEALEDEDDEDFEDEDFEDEDFEDEDDEDFEDEEDEDLEEDQE